MNTKYILSAGFLLVIGLLISLIQLSLSYTNKTIQHNHQFAQDDERIELITSMLIATHKRTNLVYKMSFIEDPFERDELFMKFRHAGSEFLQKMDLLFKKKQYDFEKEAWKNITPLLTQGGNLRNEAINQIMDGYEGDARKLTVEKLFPVQNQVTTAIESLLNRMQSIKKEQNNDAITVTYSNHDKTFLLSIVAVLLSLLIATYIIYRITTTEKHLLTERHRAENASNHKSQFLANMSHEIRTPLTSILGYTDILKNNEELPEKFRPLLETVHQSGNHLLGLIRDVLDLSKIESNKLDIRIQESNFLDIVNNTTAQLAAIADSKGIIIKTNVSYPFPITVNTDPVRVRQVIYNLLGNAIKFARQGSVAIDCSYDQKSKVVTFSVQDNGPGICEKCSDCDMAQNAKTGSPIESNIIPIDCEKKAQALFGAFIQGEGGNHGRELGSGLGLYISREIANKLGGKIVCRCIPNQAGANFTFSFIAESMNKYYQNKDEYVAQQTSSVSFMHKLEGKILIAEDVDDLAGLLAVLLKEMGLSSHRVNNGASAVLQANEGDYDAILMDKQMPTMDGIEATRKIRELGYDKPIIALSADVMKDNIKIFRDVGATDFIAKPFNRQSLYKILSRYLPFSQDEDSKPMMPKEKAEQFKSLLALFRKTLGEKTQHILEAIENSNFDSISEIAHSIKGQGSSFGYPSISELGRDIETEAKAGNLNRLLELVRKLETACSEITIEHNPLLLKASN